MMLPAILAAAALQTCPVPITLAVGTEIPVETREALSSKVDVKGRMVAMAVSEDVVIDGAVAIAKGTPVTGQIADAQATGGLGTSGRLLVRPLYLQVANRTVRLRGGTLRKRGVSAGGVIGLAVLSLATSGRTATIPAGTRVPAEVERDVVVERHCPAP